MNGFHGLNFVPGNFNIASWKHQVLKTPVYRPRTFPQTAPGAQKFHKKKISQIE